MRQMRQSPRSSSMNSKAIGTGSLLRIAVICIPFFHFVPANGEDRYSTITIKNESRAFNLIPTIEIFPDGPQPIGETAPNTSKYQFKLSESNWFNDANIKLTWKDAY